MKQCYLLLCFLFLSAGLSAQVYVNASATGSNDGTTWADAFTSIDAAVAAADNGAEIWVAAGSYIPGGDTTLVIDKDLTLIGGFAGTETSSDEADGGANPTILSGDIDGDDDLTDLTVNRDDNVGMIFVDSLLTGVSFANFNFVSGHRDTTLADDFINEYSGGAIVAYSPISVSSSTFVGNVADFGAGIAVFGGATGSTFDDLTVAENMSTARGIIASFTPNVSITNSSFSGNVTVRGAFYTEAPLTTIDNCTFEGNVASDRGAGVALTFAAPSTISNTVFLNNACGAGGLGGAVYSAGANGSEDPNDLVISDCEFTGNDGAGGAGGGISLISANMLVQNTSFSLNTSADRGGAVWASNSDLELTKVLRFENCTFTENATTGGTQLGATIYTQRSHVIEIDSSEFSQNGNGTDAGGGSALCLLGDFSETTRRQEVTINATTFTQNESTSQGGAIYIQTPGFFNTLTVTNSEFLGNNSPSIGGAIFTRPGVISSFDECFIFANSADDGGFIWALDEEDAPGPGSMPASVTITNSVVRENAAFTQGGAIDVTGGTELVATNNLFFGNRLDGGEDAGVGGAIVINGDSAAVQTALLVNNTFYENFGGAGGDDVGIFLPAVIGPDASSTLTMQNNAFTSLGGVGNVSIEAGFGTPDVVSNGGNLFTQEPIDFTVAAEDIIDEDLDPLELFTSVDDFEEVDFSINVDLTDNPLINNGTTGDDVPETDIVGTVRDNMPDIGAYEVSLELGTVVDIIAESDDHAVLETVLGVAGLISTLEGEGPFTVFAPTDAAFAAIPAATLATIQADVTGLLTPTLLTHVVGDELLSTEITDGLVVPSLAPSTNLTFGTTGGVTVTTEQAAVANVTMVDLMASNGVVHVIDAVLIPAIVSVSEIDGAGIDVEFFPNPVQSLMNVRVNDLSIGEMNVSVINVNGQRLSNWTFGNGDNMIDFSRIPAGTYTLEINIDGQVYSKQIVKQ